MPRLLSALTLLTAGLGLAACSGGDITVKTDLDEKYIVKESAVTTTPFNWEQKIKDWEVRKKEWQEMASRWESNFSGCLASLDYDFCSRLYGAEIAQSKSKAEESAKSIIALKGFQGNGENPVTSIRYRPIFVDVNNERNAMGYVSLTCLNPRLTSKEAKRLFDLLELKEDLVSKKKTPKQDAYTAVSLEVCKKYAYQDANRFSYNIDEDQSKDKAAK